MKYFAPDSPIRKAIDTGGGQSCDVDGVLRELDRAGYVLMSSNELIGLRAGNSILNEMVAERDATIERLRAALTKIRDVVGTSTEAHHIARGALGQD